MAKDATNTKSTALEVEDRVRDVFNLLLLGANRRKILQYASKWGISDRQVDRYIGRANEEFKHTATRDRDLNFGKASARLEHLFATAMQAHELRQALAVEREIISLHGLRDLELETLEQRLTQLEQRLTGGSTL
jgi:hypothetical protein